MNTHKQIDTDPYHKALLKVLAQCTGGRVYLSDLPSFFPSNSRHNQYHLYRPLHSLSFVDSGIIHSITLPALTQADLRRLRYLNQKKPSENPRLFNLALKYILREPSRSLEDKPSTVVITDITHLEGSSSLNVLDESVEQVVKVSCLNSDSEDTLDSSFASCESGSTVDESCESESITPDSNNDHQAPISEDKMAEGASGPSPLFGNDKERCPLLDSIYISTLTSNFGPYRKLVLTSLSAQWFKRPVTRYDDSMIIAASIFCTARLDKMESFSNVKHLTC